MIGLDDKMRERRHRADLLESFDMLMIMHGTYLGEALLEMGTTMAHWRARLQGDTEPGPIMRMLLEQEKRDGR